MTCSKCGARLTSTTGFCPSCGQPIVGFAVGQAAPPQTIPSAVAPVYGAAPGAIAPGAQASVAYAGFWLRVVAAFVDGIIISIPLAPIFLILMLPLIRNMQNPQDMQNPTLLFQLMAPKLGIIMLIFIVVSWLYWALCESSAWQATIGKKILGLYVTDSDHNRASFGRTSGRFFAGRFVASIPYVGGMYGLVDCLCVAFTAKKQAIHDMIAGTLVLRKT
jgi:uncharacterized RDD family membrane protein YckC